MSEEYDLKKSKETIGQLYPILEAKDGEIIDGFHRKEADSNWKRIRLENIDTKEKKLLARLISNFHRRVVSAEEKAEWINGLAEIYQKQGYKVGIGGSGRKNEVRQKIVEVTGLTQPLVNSLLSDKYKARVREESYRSPIISATKRIEHELGSEVVARHREEVKAELLKSPEFQREVIKEISKPQIVKVTDPCPSGVCHLPSGIDAGPPLDITAIMIKEFWENYPQCQCKECEHYNDCGIHARGVIQR